MRFPHGCRRRLLRRRQDRRWLAVGTSHPPARGEDDQRAEPHLGPYRFIEEQPTEERRPGSAVNSRTPSACASAPAYARASNWMPRLPSKPASTARPNAHHVGNGAPTAAGDSNTIGITALVSVSNVEPSLAARARITMAASAYVSAAARIAASPKARSPSKRGHPARS